MFFECEFFDRREGSMSGPAKRERENEGNGQIGFASYADALNAQIGLEEAHKEKGKARARSAREEKEYRKDLRSAWRGWKSVCGKMSEEEWTRRRERVLEKTRMDSEARVNRVAHGVDVARDALSRAEAELKRFGCLTRAELELKCQAWHEAFGVREAAQEAHRKEERKLREAKEKEEQHVARIEELLFRRDKMARGVGRQLLAEAQSYSKARVEESKREVEELGRQVKAAKEESKASKKRKAGR